MQCERRTLSWALYASFSSSREFMLGKFPRGEYVNSRAAKKYIFLQISTMTGALTMERIIAFLKVNLMIIFCWPLPMTATRFQVVRNKLLQWLCGIHGTLGAISVVYTIWVAHEDPFFVMKLCSLMTAIGHVPIQIILYALEHDRLQVRRQYVISLGFSQWRIAIASNAPCPTRRKEKRLFALNFNRQFRLKRWQITNRSWLTRGKDKKIVPVKLSIFLHLAFANYEPVPAVKTEREHCACVCVCVFALNISSLFPF